MKNVNTENWIEINAKGRTLGRLATEISVYLLGKNKPTYSPDKLSSNIVIITNASEINVTGSKLDNKEIYSEIEAHVNDLNNRFSDPEQLKKFSILPRDFTIDDGELTPTLKIRRKQISQNWSSNIESMYID